MAINIDGDGLIALGGTSTTQGRLRLAEDTDNGTNFIELTAPASIAADVTFTLPAADGTANQVLKTDGSGNLGFATPSAGKVLQVVSTSKTDVFSTASTSFVDVTGLSVAITPSSATSKILIIAQVSASMTGDSGQSHSFKVVGGNTASYIGDSAGNRVRGVFGIAGVSGGAYMASSSIVYLDSPATTSATTYKIQAQVGQSATTSYVNRSGSDTNNIDTARGASSITVMEIAG